MKTPLTSLLRHVTATTPDLRRQLAFACDQPALGFDAPHVSSGRLPGHLRAERAESVLTGRPSGLVG